MPIGRKSARRAMHDAETQYLLQRHCSCGVRPLPFMPERLINS
jgi:hypothetical protein